MRKTTGSLFRNYGRDPMGTSVPSSWHDHWLMEALGGFALGAVGFHNFIGWVLVSLGWLSTHEAWSVASMVGIWLGATLGIGNIRYQRWHRTKE